jgi:hypothetical protein
MKDYLNLSISKEIQNILSAYNNSITIVGGLDFRQRDVIRMIEFYTNSKYLNGGKDEMGRDKPFYNIVNGMCDVENAAKDIDTKNIVATADDGQHYTETFLLNKDIYEWMKASNFAKTLNEMRDTHTRYGSLLVKKCIEYEDGEKKLEIDIPEWKNVITDQVDIEDGPIIECHYMTPVEMMKMKEWVNVEDVIARAVSDNGYVSRIPVYEVRGWFPVSFLKEIDGKKVSKTDRTNFTYQLYYMAGEYQGTDIFNQTEDVTSRFSLGALVPLYWENDTEEVYKYLSRKPRAGRAFGVGVVEEGEEAQVWTNDTVLKQFRAMEYTTKVVGQSASKKLKGRNMLNEVDDGQILEHEDGKPITTLTLLPAGGLSQYSNLLVQWFTQFERATSAYGAQRGESPSSRTAAKLQAAVLQQSGSVMQTIQEDFGIFVGNIMEDWVMPWLGKQLNAEHILAHEFGIDELKQIDRNFSIHTANRMAKEAILSGKIVSEEDYATFMQGAQDMIQQTKATRFIEVPKDYYKKATAHVTFNITGEQKDKQAAADFLLGVMKIYQGDPNLINDPVLTSLLMQIIEQSGFAISPVTIIAAIQEKARLVAEAAKAGGQKQQQKVSQSINYKDLPPDGQRQMAAEVGIDIQPSPTVQQPQAESPSGGQATPMTPPAA